MNEMLLPSGESWNPAFSGFLKKSRSGMRFAALDDAAPAASPSGDRARAVPAPAMPQAAAALDRKKRRLSMVFLLIRPSWPQMLRRFYGLPAGRDVTAVTGCEVADKSVRAYYPSGSAGLRCGCAPGTTPAKDFVHQGIGHA